MSVFRRYFVCRFSLSLFHVFVVAQGSVLTSIVLRYICLCLCCRWVIGFIWEKGGGVENEESKWNRFLVFFSPVLIEVIGDFDCCRRHLEQSWMWITPRTCISICSVASKFTSFRLSGRIGGKWRVGPCFIRFTGIVSGAVVAGPGH